MAPKVAKDIISFCTSCRRDVMHTVVAMDGERVVRVLCLSCKKEHAYHRPSDLKDDSPKRVRAPRASASKRMTVGQEWGKEMDRLRDKPAKSYSMDGQFDVGDKISHKAFGTGFVLKDQSSIKMEVLFEREIKVLVRAGTTKPLS
jgi:hypothetical protein